MTVFQERDEQLKEFKEKVAKELDKHGELYTTDLGVSLVSSVPTDTFVLLKGMVQQSSITLSEQKKIDEQEIFTFEVAGYGYKVTDLNLGDCINCFGGQKIQVLIKENVKSIASMRKWLRELKSSELNELIASTKKLDCVEYFMVQRYDICQINL